MRASNPWATGSDRRGVKAQQDVSERKRLLRDSGLHV